MPAAERFGMTQTQEPTEQAAAIQNDKAHILIVDDEASVRYVLREISEAAGYRCSVVGGGIAALQFCQREQPDLAIVDMLMPDKAGLETIEELGQAYPAMRIVAISGGGFRGPKQLLSWAENNGADRAFAKPFVVTDLMNAIAELLEG